MSGEFLTTHFYENKTLRIQDDTLDTALVEGIEMELGKLKRLLQRTTEVFFLLVVLFSNSAFSDSTCSNQTTAGYQVINVGGNKTLSSPALSYVEDSFYFVVTVDGQSYVVTGGGYSDAIITYGDLINIINSKILNAKAAIVGGNIRITSDSFGAHSKILMSDFGYSDGDLRPHLNGYVSVMPPVNGTSTNAPAYRIINVGGNKAIDSPTGLPNNSNYYDINIAWDNSNNNFDVSIQGYKAQTYGELITFINNTLASEALGNDVSPAEVRLAGGNLVVSSPSIGEASYVNVQNYGLLTSLSGFVNIGPMVPGQGTSSGCYVNRPLEPALSSPTVADNYDLLPLAGDFSVNQSGQAIYSIPIITAPAGGNFAPNLSFEYSSGAGNSEMGLGWFMSGLGSISRCRQTEGQDKNAAPISWGSSDRFCLNGQRLLVEPNYSYGAPNSRYKTERDQFSRITAVGGTAGAPTYFKVEHKDGRIDYYGREYTTSETAKYKLGENKVLSWLISASEDSAGNKIRYYYYSDTENYGVKPIINNIDYAFDINGANPSAQISFVWGSRSDLTRGYISGESYYSSDRLQKVISKNNGQQIREYRLTYDQIAPVFLNDELSRLTSIEECVNSICRKPTTFDWSKPNISGLNSSTGSFTLEDEFTPFKTYELADINGDSLLDVAWMHSGQTKVHFAIASLDSQGNMVYTEQNFENNGVVNLNYYTYEGPKISFTDYNNDGRADLLLYQKTEPIQVSVYLSKPQSDGTWKLASNPVQVFSQTWGDVLIADLNADGLEDVMNYQTRRVRYLRPGGAGYGPETVINVVTPPAYNSSLCPSGPISRLRHETGDFNGDGRLDFIAIACVASAGSVRYEQHIYTSHLASNNQIELRFLSKLSNAQSTKPITLSPCGQSDPGVESESRASGPIKVVDINNDGLSDVIGGDFYCNIVFFRLNTGTSFSSKIDLPSTFAYEKYYADINQDGFPDLLSQTYDSTNFAVNLWDTGINNFSSSVSYLDVSHVSHLDNIRFEDINSDGAIDYFSTTKFYSSSSPNQKIQLHKKSYNGTNKVSVITNGLGKTININYEPLSSSQHYSFIRGVNSSGVSESICQDTDVGDVCWSRQKMVSSSSAFSSFINNPFSDLPSGNQRLGTTPLHPVFNIAGAMEVVTETSQSSPSGSETLPNNPQIYNKEFHSYYYELARVQASGRGFLGFKRVTQINHQSGLRNTTEYRQDWPFNGLQIKKETYTAEGSRLSTTSNIWGFANCYSSVGVTISGCESIMSSTIRNNGNAAWGAVQIIKRNSEEEVYSLLNNGSNQGILLGKNLSSWLRDNKGNVTVENIETYDETNSLIRSKINNKQYSYSGSTYSMQMGRLQQKNEALSDGLGNSVARNYGYTYKTTGKAIGLLETETVEPNNPTFIKTVTHVYDSFGNRTQSNIASEGKTRYGDRILYDSKGRYITNLYKYKVNPDSPTGNVSSYLYNTVLTRDAYGLPTKVKEISGPQSLNEKLRVLANNAFGSKYFESISTGEAAHKTYRESYPSCPASITKYAVLEYSPNMSNSVNKTSCYDMNQRVLRQLQFNGYKTVIIDTEYNKAGQILRKSEPYVSGSASVYWTRYEYDVIGRMTKIYHPYQDAVTEITYDGPWKITNKGMGRTRSEKLNLVWQITETVDAHGQHTYFTYDPDGNLTNMTDPLGNSTSMTYDILGRKTSINDPSVGLVTYKYNNFGDLICQEDSLNQHIINTYDSVGRLLNRKNYTAGGTCDLPTGTMQSNSTWRYDVNSYEQFDLVKDSVTGYEKQYTFDRFGRINVTRHRVPGINNQIADHYEQITYDQNGRVFQVFDAARSNQNFSNNGIQYIYKNGRIDKIVDAVFKNGQSLTVYQDVISMDARENITGVTYGNGVTRAMTYDLSSGLLTHLSASNGGATPIQNLTLNWDQLGNLESRIEQGAGSGFSPRLLHEEYEYDDLNQLESWTYSGVFNGSETYSYNEIGNVLNKTGRGAYYYGSQCGHTNVAGPHAACRVGSTNYYYNAKGQQTGDATGRNITYGVLDKPITIVKGNHTTRFAYGPDHSRYKRIDEGTNGVTTTLYIGSVEKIYYPDGTSQWRRAIAGVALVTDKFNSSGTLTDTEKHYPINDHLGTLSLLTDNSGAVVDELYSDPWGQPRKPQLLSGQYKAVLDKPFLISFKPITTRSFTSHEMMDETGLVHMNGRVYDPAISRFIQPDPIIQSPFETQSLNRYSYVWNNPMNSTDPNGYQRKLDFEEAPELIRDQGMERDKDAMEGCGARCRYERRHGDSDTFEHVVSEENVMAAITGFGTSGNSFGYEWITAVTYSDDGSNDKSTQNLFVQRAFDAQEGRERSCGGRPCVDRGDGPWYAVGFSGSVTHPLYSVPASAVNLMLDDPFLPTGLSGGIWQNANGDQFGGALEVGAEYTAGIGSRIVGSLDVIEIGAVPDMEFSLVIGLGARLYYQNENFVGFGFAAGGGASWLTKPLSSKAVNAEIGGSLSRRVEW